LRAAGLAVFRAVERVATFGLVLGLVMGSSEVHAAPSAAPPQPRPGNYPAGQDPEARLSRPSHHSNAPIKPKSQSILSKIVAHFLNRFDPESLRIEGTARLRGSDASLGRKAMDFHFRHPEIRILPPPSGSPTLRQSVPNRRRNARQHATLLFHKPAFSCRRSAKGSPSPNFTIV
jgi:hypothetical protein